MKKIILPLTVIFILFLSFSAVQAADDNSTQKTFDEIQTTIDESDNAETIILDGSYHGSGNSINVNKSLTIKGNGDGAYLYANDRTRTMNIDADDVTLENLIFVGKSMTYTNGAIYSTGNNLKIINCKFISNEDQNGGAIESQGDNVTIKNCQFTQNTAITSGGAIALSGNNNYVTDCTFTNNYAGHVGGDIAWIGDNGLLTNSKFTAPTASSKISQFGSSIVWIGANGTLTKSVFTLYDVKVNGSAVYWRGSNGILNYCIFEKTDSKNKAVYWGNPEYANNNYWGFNINSTDEFKNQQLIAYSGTFAAPQKWVNIISKDNYINFTSNNGEKLEDVLPDYKYNSVTIINNTHINKITTKITASKIITYAKYAGKSLKITLKDANNKAVSNKRVYLTVNGKTYNEQTNSNGATNFKINIKNAGTYAGKISFKTDNNYKASSKTVKITVKKQKPSITIKTTKKTVTVFLKDQFKKAIAKKTVKLTINKKTYTAKTNNKGIVLFKITIKSKGTYKITAKYNGDKTYKTTSKTVKVRF